VQDEKARACSAIRKAIDSLTKALECVALDDLDAADGCLMDDAPCTTCHWSAGRSIYSPISAPDRSARRSVRPVQCGA
jgi:hypothetical protein